MGGLEPGLEGQRLKDWGEGAIGPVNTEDVGQKQPWKHYTDVYLDAILARATGIIRPTCTMNYRKACRMSPSLRQDSNGGRFNPKQSFRRTVVIIVA